MIKSLKRFDLCGILYVSYFCHTNINVHWVIPNLQTDSIKMFGFSYFVWCYSRVTLDSGHRCESDYERFRDWRQLAIRAKIAARK